ncbi:MAG TPA: CAP domain-containing protein [Candidatus Paceibacterota bacterium]|nr:CAP domain-containing protein [Candidatus Paceibacterota bacterium]
MQRPKRSLIGRVHDYLFPHAGNNYHPHFFRPASVTAIVLALLVLEGAYFADIRVLFKNSDFLASVLPSVLASLTNADRVENNIPMVTENAVLAQAATNAAQDMAAHGYFSHVSPEGKTPWYWLNQVGYAYTYAGQNLAVNFTDSNEVERAWMNSPTHHANIVKAEYTEVGIGVAQGMYEGREAAFVVQFFATPPPKVAAAPSPTATSAKPKEVAIIAAPTTSPSVSTSTAVLGVEASQAAPPEKQNFFKRILVTPRSSMEILGTLFVALIAVLFALAVSMGAHMRHPRIIAVSVFLITITSGALILNTWTAGDVILPVDTQSASIATALAR